MLQNKKPAGGKNSSADQFRQISDFHFSKTFITTAVVNAVLAVATILAVHYCAKGTELSYKNQLSPLSVSATLQLLVSDGKGAMNDVMRMISFSNDQIRFVYECALLVLLSFALQVVVANIIDMRQSKTSTMSEDIKLSLASQGFDVSAAEVRFVRKDAYARAMRNPSKQSLDEFSHSQPGYYY
jgi:hypothetical protein